MNPPSIWVVTPAYNEAKVIASTVQSCLPYVDGIIVVDDCSIDGTFMQAIQSGAHTLRHPVNLGQGAALQTGIEYALQQHADYIVTFDADGQHEASEIISMVKALSSSAAEIALGSRFIARTVEIPLVRKVILKLAIIFTLITTKAHFSDVHNGFRAMTSSFCKTFVFNQNRMAHASEILEYISKNKIKYIEFPVTIKYTEYSLGKGQRNTNAFRIILELLWGYFSR